MSGFGGYGGGFMQQQTPVKGGGSSYGSQNEISGSPAPFGSPMAKKNNEQSLRHCTIKQVLEAREIIADSPCELDGRPLGTICILGRINATQEKSTHVQYTIDDGTGQIDASLWADTNKVGLDEAAEASREALQEGVYVQVMGPMRIFQKKRTLMAHSIKVVDNMDQVTFHQLMATYVHMYLTGGEARRQFGGGAFAGQMGSTSGSHHSMYASAAPLPVQTSHYTPLQDQVLGTIRALDNGTHIDGVKFQDLAYKLRGSASDMDIRNCLNALMNDSAVYTTTDDDTFKLS